MAISQIYAALPMSASDSIRFTGEDKAKGVAAFLVERSAAFKITPLPDDIWSVEVKPENTAAVQLFLRGALL